MTNPTLVPGDQIHFLKSGLIIPLSRVEPDDLIGAFAIRSPESHRGQTITLTQGIIDANQPLLSRIDDPEAQRERWGEPVAGRGPFPEGVAKYTRGTVEEEIERDRLRASALAEPDEQVREAALAKLRRTMGSAPTSRTIAEYSGTDGRFRDA